MRRDWVLDGATGQPTSETRTPSGGTGEVQWEQAYDDPMGYGRVTMRKVREGSGVDLGEANSTETTYEYTGLQTKTLVDPVGSSTAPFYESTSIALSTGQVSVMESGDADDAVEDPRTRYDYDPVTGGLDFVRRAIDYDAMGDPVWSSTDVENDALGRLDTILPPGSPDPMDLGYDLSGRMTSMYGGRSGDLTLAYDPRGWQESQDHSVQGTTSFVRDELGRVIEQTGPNGTSKMRYDDAGRVVWRQDVRGNETRIVHDDLGRVAKRILPDGTVWTNEYCSNLGCGSCGASAAACRVVGPDGQVVLEREHDELGRVTRVTDAEGNWVEMDYDEAGRLSLKRFQQSIHRDPTLPIAAQPDIVPLEFQYEYLCPCQLRWAPPAGVVTA